MKKIVIPMIIVAMSLCLASCKKASSEPTSTDGNDAMKPQQTTNAMLIESVLRSTTEDELVRALDEQIVTDEVWDNMCASLELNVEEIEEVFVSQDKHKYCIYFNTSTSNNTAFVSYNDAWEIDKYEIY